jgi:hypothetical protein
MGGGENYANPNKIHPTSNRTKQKNPFQLSETDF